MVALAFIGCVFRIFVGGAIAFIKDVVIIIGKGGSAIGRKSFKIPVMFISKGSSAIKKWLFKTAVTFIGKGSLAVGRSFKTAVIFISKGNLAVGGRLFKTAGAGAGVTDDIKGVDERDLR